MKFTFLVDNKTENAKCMAEWGLSVLIESRGRKILLDTGTTDLYKDNAQKLGIRLEDVDALVISHGHYDHTGGVPSFVALNGKAPVYLHKDGLYEAYGITDGKTDEKPCSILWGQEELEAVRPRIRFTEGRVDLGDGVSLIGDIPQAEGFAPTDRFLRVLEDGSMVPDTMSHEQVLVFEEEAGLYVFSGCSHTGVISIIRHIQSLYPGKRIAGLVAGMHLYPAAPDDRKKIVAEIAALDLDVLFPVHCTGMEAILQLRERMGGKCVVACAGDTYEF